MLKNSDQDNLDSTYIESAIFGLWKINLVNFIKTKASLSKNFHIQPTEVDKMPMWEYELFLSHLNDLVKEENENQQKEMSKYNIDEYKKMSNPSNMKRMTSTPKYSMPKMPSMSQSFK